MNRILNLPQNRYGICTRMPATWNGQGLRSDTSSFGTPTSASSAFEPRLRSSLMESARPSLPVVFGALSLILTLRLSPKLSEKNFNN